MADLRILGHLPDDLVDPTRELLDRSFGGDFTEDDWDHAQGGVHALLTDGSTVLAHASAVPRDLRIDDRWYRAGYVEAVAADPDQQGRGLGSQVVHAVSAVIRDRDDLGMLSTAIPGFYERLGWERWSGSSWVLDGDGLRRTPDEDGGLMVLRTDGSRHLGLDGAVACQARSGDDW